MAIPEPLAFAGVLFRTAKYGRDVAFLSMEDLFYELNTNGLKPQKIAFTKDCERKNRPLFA